MLNKRLIIGLLIFISVNLAAQNTDGTETADSLRKPVFPAGSTALVYIEGEDAVSTNFANQAVSNFGCSGYRSVQLNRQTGLQGGASFYAEFVFYIEEAGDYEFWYGGTPPGPADELSPSYASPFSLSLDGAPAESVFREDVNVIEGYTPSYYWNKYSVFSLSEGSHRLRLEVSDKRGYDGRYYFYLDSLFFLNRDKIDEIDAVKPDTFPTMLESTAIDNPFLSVNDYQTYIDSNPDEMSAYIELSLVYSLLSDYQSALKVLNKAMALDSSDSYPIVLAAKNRLWKGDVRESLALYERALGINPDDPLLWSEAGKVAAWSAEYDRSIDFYVRGIAKFPDDLNMLVNLGLTYIWMARDADAEAAFSTALKTASASPELLSKLGWIQEAVGYPEYAREVYESSIEKFPSYLEFYLLLQSSYLSSGDRESADETGRRIESTFKSSERLQNELEVYKAKLNLRDEVINSYLARLREDPGNLELRQELAQTFFWNGMSTEAIEQIRYVITTYSYRAAETYTRRNSELLSLVDLTAAIQPFFENYPGWVQASKKKISTAASALAKAEKAAASDDSGASALPLREAGQALADSVAEAEMLSDLLDEQSLVVDSFRNAIEELRVSEKSEEEGFQAANSSGWFWDKTWQSGELNEILQDERQLASFMLGRLYLSDGRYSKAAEVLMPESEAGAVIIETADDSELSDAEELQHQDYDFSELETGSLYSLYQALLFGGDTGFEGPRAILIDDELQRLSDEYPRLAEVEQQLKLASEPLTELIPGIYYDGLEEETAELISALEEQSETAEELLKEIVTFYKQLTAAAAKRLERSNYYLEADTYLIRYELGNYYLEDGMNKEASEQFRRVIAIDPWNISAAYKLGVVEQRYGDWSEAMKHYKKVYQQDSGYENAVNYYNQLAREHSDRFDSLIQLSSSPSEISFIGQLTYAVEFNSLFGLGVSYELDQQRQYRDFTGADQGSFQMHLIEAELPLTFGEIGLVLTPLGGVYAESIYYKTDYDFPTEATVSLSEFAGTISTYPKFGASVLWTWDILTLDLSWENALEADTIYEDRNLIRKNDIALNMNTWFNLSDYDLLGPLTTRTYGRVQLMDDDNIKWQAYQDVMLGVNLLNNPVIRLSPSASVNFETSKTAPAVDYYAPKNVLEAKGGLRSSFTFPSTDWSSAFEAVLWGGTGGYWSNLGDAAAESSLKVEGGVGATYVKNSNVYYLNISGLGTFSELENQYWEISLSLGTGLNLPGLLVP